MNAVFTQFRCLAIEVRSASRLQNAKAIFYFYFFWLKFPEMNKSALKILDLKVSQSVTEIA